MKLTKFALAASLATALTACSGQGENAPGAGDSDDQAVQTPNRIAYGDLALGDGSEAGAVKIVSDGQAIKLLVAAQNLPEGTHGFHLHETGSCEAPDFASAGGHLNPLMKSHGTESADGAHVGDLPNLVITTDKDGPQEFALQGSEQQISDWIFDADGTAVVIHADPDDYKTDPSGNAGARIACAVLTGGD
ncbi:superoxide dismutase family protein [Pontixanthobacter aquaemixtae]|uniref:Superoxide dismutase family protein n=1 Tax=Pontixanthobacter aquaemixtae TaxID=1958940 RepID=A0A844ZUT5_9SPHN|nr:superoxide dismutase family protein [Pontixanthobacter aquaemixtae]MXO91234.1 superoxide dismutase family protein [Pontixanthobacter aquaemixtae]